MCFVERISRRLRGLSQHPLKDRRNSLDTMRPASDVSVCRQTRKTSTGALKDHVSPGVNTPRRRDDTDAQQQRKVRDGEGNSP